MEVSSLERIAAETEAALSAIWAETGLDAPGRASARAALCVDVTAIFRSVVECQEAMRDELKAECAAIAAEIAKMDPGVPIVRL